MKYLRVEFWAYLVVFAHKLEHRNLEVLGKMVLWRVLLHGIIRNTAEESRGIGFDGFPRNGKNKKKRHSSLLNQRKKRRDWFSQPQLPFLLLPLWPQEKSWEWWGKRAALLMASPDREQLSSRGLAGRGPVPSQRDCQQAAGKSVLISPPCATACSVIHYRMCHALTVHTEICT